MLRGDDFWGPVAAVARSVRPDYGTLPEPLAAPELPSKSARTVAAAALRELFLVWGLDRARAGSPHWNPLGEFIPPGARVLLKPNWVLHWNQSGQGFECLVTHATVIEAVLEYVALAQPSSVIVGDAPLQGCDFQALRRLCGLDAILDRFAGRGLNVDIRDFRRTVLSGGRLGQPRAEGIRDLSNFVLFDLGRDSLLEPLAADAEKFRVTMYNPELLHRTHARGRHQYLVAREVIEADVVLNLPKLKCHKKACLTGALKNLIGINGNKEYLPHHRKGGGDAGGDCYAGRSALKRAAEEILDAANRLRPGALQGMIARTAEMALRAAVQIGADENLEGSWYGNDTIWRTCLDLQRILAYGCTDGTLGGRCRRRVISITDAIVAGEGEGPLAPTPVYSGFLTGAANPAAAEWVHARLMGFDPNRIPLVREAFGGFLWPLADFDPGDVIVRTKDGERRAPAVVPLGRPFLAPKGWAGHCELVSDDDPRFRKQAVVA